MKKVGGIQLCKESDWVESGWRAAVAVAVASSGSRGKRLPAETAELLLKVSFLPFVHLRFHKIAVIA